MKWTFFLAMGFWVIAGLLNSFPFDAKSGTLWLAIVNIGIVLFIYEKELEAM